MLFGTLRISPLSRRPIKHVETLAIRPFGPVAGSLVRGNSPTPASPFGRTRALLRMNGVILATVKKILTVSCERDFLSQKQAFG